MFFRRACSKLMLGIKLFFLSLLSFLWVVSLILAYLNSSSPWLFQELLANRIGQGQPQKLLKGKPILPAYATADRDLILRLLCRQIVIPSCLRANTHRQMQNQDLEHHHHFVSRPTPRPLGRAFESFFQGRTKSLPIDNLI